MLHHTHAGTHPAKEHVCAVNAGPWPVVCGVLVDEQELRAPLLRHHTEPGPAPQRHGHTQAGGMQLQVAAAGPDPGSVWYIDSVILGSCCSTWNLWAEHWRPSAHEVQGSLYGTMEMSVSVPQCSLTVTVALNVQPWQWLEPESLSLDEWSTSLCMAVPIAAGVQVQTSMADSDPGRIWICDRLVRLDCRVQTAGTVLAASACRQLPCFVTAWLACRFGPHTNDTIQSDHCGLAKSLVTLDSPSNYDLGAKIGVLVLLFSPLFRGGLNRVDDPWI